MTSIDINALMRDQKIYSRHELITLAAMVARTQGLSASAALRKIQNGEIDPAHVQEQVIQKQQAQLPEPVPSHSEDQDDPTTQS